MTPSTNLSRCRDQECAIPVAVCFDLDCKKQAIASSQVPEGSSIIRKRVWGGSVFGFEAEEWKRRIDD
jgi:hypothetical protein